MGTFYRDQQLLANQFCDGSDFAIWLEEKLRSYDNAGDLLQYLQDNLDIYEAEKHWLDLFGIVVGQSREVPDAIPVEFFGFFDTSFAVGFGEARFWNGVESLAASSILADPEYRTILLAKIAFNYADVTLTGIASSLSIIFDTTDLTVTNNGTANIDIFINKTLTTTEQNLFNAIDILPRAAGVSIDLSFPP